MKHAIPGSFTDEATKRIRWVKLDEIDMAGNRATRYTAEVHDSILKAILSRDPMPSGLLWHLSVSGPNRLPSWDELKHAKYRLVHANVAMVLLFPRSNVPYMDLHQYCLHLYESTEKDVDC